MGVCRINPEDPDASDHLSRWTEEDGFHGVRLSPSVGSDGDWFAGPLDAPNLPGAPKPSVFQC